MKDPLLFIFVIKVSGQQLVFSVWNKKGSRQML